MDEAVTQRRDFFNNQMSKYAPAEALMQSHVFDDVVRFEKEFFKRLEERNGDE